MVAGPAAGTTAAVTDEFLVSDLEFAEVVDVDQLLATTDRDDGLDPDEPEPSDFHKIIVAFDELGRAGQACTDAFHALHGTLAAFYLSWSWDARWEWMRNAWPGEPWYRSLWRVVAMRWYVRRGITTRR